MSRGIWFLFFTIPMLYYFLYGTITKTKTLNSEKRKKNGNPRRKIT